MALNFPDSPTLNQVYTDVTSGFSYQWDGVVWQSYTPSASKNIKILDDISPSFDGVTSIFSITISGSAFTPANAQQLRIVLGGIVQNPETDYTVSGSNITFTTPPGSSLSFSGVSFGPAVPINIIDDGTVTPSKLSTGSPSWNTDGDVYISGITTITNASGTVIAGIGTTALIVEGNARVTGILTVGTGSVTINGTTDRITVGTGLTLSSSGIIAGVVTATTFSGNVTGNITIGAGSTSAPSLAPSGDSNTGVFFPSADTIAFAEGGAEAARFDSSGRLLVGASSGRGVGSSVQLSTQIESISGNYPGLSITQNGADTGAGYLHFGKTRGTSVGSSTIVQNGDRLGTIRFAGADGTDLESVGALIETYVDGTPGANDMPGRLIFSTTADGASSPTERMRIDSDGQVGIGKTPSFNASTAGVEISPLGVIIVARDIASGGVLQVINRKGSDGSLVNFQQDTVNEGSISVSGSTVSYNGAHLSRWSQLPGEAERADILRGTVLSNVDEMCEWGEEDNEQLNRMKVSDVEGDKNVSGVFQAWDDDDDTYTNDFYCAMTGDFIIRIGAGITVQRGDLLMSAGDGTAKPQDDDIVRSKTVAKVTSTSVTCTYDDGSYCVPCVLMAC